MDVAGVVESAFSAAAAIASAYSARKGHNNAKKLDRTNTMVERMRNGELTPRIMSAVRDVLAEQRGDEIRLLMDAIIRHASEPDA